MGMAKKQYDTSSIDKFFSNTEETEHVHEAGNMSETDNMSMAFDMSITDEMHNTDNVSKPQKKQYYRFNLKMPLEYKEFLDEAAWQSRKNITQYINDLIKREMDEK